MTGFTVRHFLQIKGHYRTASTIQTIKSCLCLCTTYNHLTTELPENIKFFTFWVVPQLSG